MPQPSDSDHRFFVGQGNQEIPWLDRIIEVAPIATLVLSSGRVRWANAEAELLFGMNPRQYLFDDLVEIRDGVCEALTAIGRIAVELDRRQMGPDHTIVFVHDHRFLRSLQSEIVEARHFLDLIDGAYQPPRLGNLGGMRLGVWSQPAGRLGGDFIDLVPLANGAKALIVADASGSGGFAFVLAAAVRRYLRAYLTSEPLLTKTLQLASDAICSEFSSARFATCIVAVVHPSSLTVELASAGHPSPVWVSRGRAHAIALPACPALGLARGQQYASRLIALEADDGLILFSDGLIEHHDENGRSFGTQGLADAAAAATDERAALGAIRLAAQRLGPEFSDDVAVAALWATPASPPVTTIHFPPAPGRIRGVRHAIQHLLEQAGLTRDAVEEMMVATGEALNNAVEHGPVAGRDDAIEASCETLEDVVVVRVKSPKTGWDVAAPRDAGSTRGFGLRVMRAVSDGVEIQQGPDGTLVSIKKRRIKP